MRVNQILMGNKPKKTLHWERIRNLIVKNGAGPSRVLAMRADRGYLRRQLRSIKTYWEEGPGAESLISETRRLQNQVELLYKNLEFSEFLNERKKPENQGLTVTSIWESIRDRLGSCRERLTQDKIHVRGNNDWQLLVQTYRSLIDSHYFLQYVIEYILNTLEPNEITLAVDLFNS